MSKARTRAASFAGTATDGYVLTSDAVGVGSWESSTSPPSITDFEYSDGSTATAERTLAFTVVCGTIDTSTTVTVAGDTTGIVVGHVVSGTGIPLGTTVVSVSLNTSFGISAAATATSGGTPVTLTFSGSVIITGTLFDSILGGDAANIAVTFDSISATSISVNAGKTIITCTPPAHAAGIITLRIVNANGLAATRDFIYDEEAIFTTAAGSIGNFLNGDFTGTPDSTYPQIEATDGEDPAVALSTGFQQVTSAVDETVITTGIQGLYVQDSGYLTGTLAGSHATTYPFYATAKDSQNQRTAPRLFSILTYAYPGIGGDLVITEVEGFIIHKYTTIGDTATFTVLENKTVDWLVIAGGGSGSFGGGGAGGFRTSFGSGSISGGLSTVEADLNLVTGTTYTITVGAGRSPSDKGSRLTTGDDSKISGGIITTITSDGGGMGGGLTGNKLPTSAAAAGGSGGGAGYRSSGSTVGSSGARTAAQGFIGGDNSGTSGESGGGGGGGAGGAGGVGSTSSTGGGYGGAGLASSITGSAVYYAGGGGGSYSGAAGLVSGNSTGAGVGRVSGSGDWSALQPTGGTASDNTGSGGGGANGGENSDFGGSGGSGIVIIRYAV